MALDIAQEAAAYLHAVAQTQESPTAVLEAVLWRAAPFAALLLWMKHVVRMKADSRRVAAAPAEPHQA